jgi:hypothetical protein
MGSVSVIAPPIWSIQHHLGSRRKDQAFNAELLLAKIPYTFDIYALLLVSPLKLHTIRLRKLPQTITKLSWFAL